MPVPPPRTTRLAGLTPAKVTAAALGLLDREGVEAFSMRALARELGVQVGALYQHVLDREALLGDVVGVILGELEMPDDALPWQEWVAAFCAAYRAALHAHAGAAPLVSGQLVSNGPQDFPAVEALLACLARGGFTGPSLVQAYDTVLGWVVGFVGVELAPAPAAGTDWVQRRQADLAAIDAERFPTLAAHRDALQDSFALRWRSGAEKPLDAAFDSSVQVLVAGLAAVHAPPRGRSRR